MVSEFQNNAASEILVPMLESLKLKVEKYRKEVDPGNSMEG